MGIHWPSLKMTFMAGDKQIILRGVPSLTKDECSLKTITETWKKDDQGLLLELQNFEIKE